MQVLQPRTLSNNELVRICADLIHTDEGLPISCQKELLRRFNVLAPAHEYPPVDPRQLDLFTPQ